MRRRGSTPIAGGEAGGLAGESCEGRKQLTGGENEGHMPDRRKKKKGGGRRRRREEFSFSLKRPFYPLTKSHNTTTVIVPLHGLFFSPPVIPRRPTALHLPPMSVSAKIHPAQFHAHIYR